MSSQLREDFERNGLAVVPDFLTEDEMQAMKDEVNRLIDEADITPDPSLIDGSVEKNINHNKQSIDKIKFFIEREAFDSNNRYIRPDIKSGLFRIAHNLHCLSPTFRRLTFSEKVKDVLKKLGYGQPRVVQGMYLFKNPQIGGEFIPHQDRTYLVLVEDDAKMVGFWFPLEDATLENGCLWYIPGSHKTGLHRKQSVQRDADGGQTLVFDKPLPEYNDKDFVAAPVKKGSCVLIDGLVVHKSAPNRSSQPRPAYTFHVFDDQHYSWDPNCYFQPTKDNPFPNVYEYPVE